MEVGLELTGEGLDWGDWVEKVGVGDPRPLTSLLSWSGRDGVDGHAVSVLSLE